MSGFIWPFFTFVNYILFPENKKQQSHDEVCYREQYCIKKFYLVQFRSDGREVIWYVLLDLLWLSSEYLPEPWRLLALHEGCNLCFPLTLILIYLFCK